MSEKFKMYFCSSCGPFVKVYKEYWTKESDSPFKVELIQHMNGLAVAVETIEIKPKPEGEPVEYNYCGHCRSMIGADLPLMWCNQNEVLLDKYTKKLAKDKK